MHNIGHIPLFDIVVFLRGKKLKYLDKTCLTTALEKGDISVRFSDFDLLTLTFLHWDTGFVVHGLLFTIKASEYC